MKVLVISLLFIPRINFRMQHGSVILDIRPAPLFGTFDVKLELNFSSGQFRMICGAKQRLHAIRNLSLLLNREHKAYTFARLGPLFAVPFPAAPSGASPERIKF